MLKITLHHLCIMVSPVCWQLDYMEAKELATK